MIFAQRFFSCTRLFKAIPNQTCLASLLCLCLAQISWAVESGHVSMDIRGGVQITRDNQPVCNMIPTAADERWRFVSAIKAGQAGDTSTRHFKLNTGSGIQGQATIQQEDQKVNTQWTFTANDDVKFNTLALAFTLPIEKMAGGSWSTESKQGTFPKDFGSTAFLYGGEQTSLTIIDPDGKECFTLVFPDKIHISIQDDRKWGGKTYTIRIGQVQGQLAKDQSYQIKMSITVPGKLTAGLDQEVVITAGKDWTPLKPELDILPGSALDLSVNQFTQGACGSKGRIIVTPEGHFAFADQPDKPQRFYGANLCFSSQYMDKKKVDALLDRWLRMGYNTLRIHHYEFGLTQPIWQPGFDWDDKKLDQLCYLIAGCAKRGIWVTTDLFVSRPIDPAQIELPATKPYINSHKRVDFQLYKALILVHEPAYRDFVRFTDQLLNHVNPYTGNRLAQEPALAWISLINEGAPGNRVKSLPQWKTAWNNWLAQRYPTRQALTEAMGNLLVSEDPSQSTVNWPEDVLGDSKRSRVCQVFLADMERKFVRRIKQHLRDELECPALLTNHNVTPYTVPDQAVFQDFDYVDTHFYVDHPVWTNVRWKLPSRSPNLNPALTGVPGGTERAVLRQWTKPFTISEFNYSAPGQYRGIGAMMTGALAGLQDWDVLWRFAYAHKDKEVFTPTPMDFFNLSRDPLALAADRAAVMLFLRGDLKPADHRVATVIYKSQLQNPPAKDTMAAMSNLAWVTQIGSAIQNPPKDSISLHLGSKEQDFENAVRQAGIDVNLDSDIIRSETGQININKKTGVVCVDTPLTAGGFAQPGQQINAQTGGVSVDGIDYGATVFVTSLDRKPIYKARRLLVTHLTDLQNTGTKYAESSRQTLLAWGQLPYLVRNGQADIQIKLADPAAYTVWALSTAGQRLEKVKTQIKRDAICFTAKVQGTNGAQMLYEVTTD